MTPLEDSQDDLEDAVDDVLESVEADVADTDPNEEHSVSKLPPMELQVAAVIPLHEVPGTAKRRRGRPKKVALQPSPSDLVYHAEMAKKQSVFVASDSIVRATKERKDSMEVLQLMKERYALILAALSFRRIENEKRGGKNSAQILSREASVLRDISALELRISEVGVQTIDLHGEQMQRIFAMFIEKIRAVALEVLPKEQVDLFFNRLETTLDGWEEEADSRLR